MNDTMQAEGRVIANFAWQHLKAASLFRDHVLRIETDHMGLPLGAFFEDIRSYASACIMSSTPRLRLSSMSYSLPTTASFGRRSATSRTSFGAVKAVKALKAGERSTSTNLRSRCSMSRSSIQRRRPIAKPRRWSNYVTRSFTISQLGTRARGREVELAEVLKGRFLVSPFPDEGADFVTMKCMSHGCARWAVETVVAFISEFDTRTQLDAKKMQAFLACGA